MRRHAHATAAAAVAAALVLAGCSSTEDGTATAAPARSSSAAAAPSSSAAAGSSSSGSVSPELTAWAADFCTAAAPLADLQTLGSAAATADLSSPDAAKKYLVDLYTSAATAFTSTSTGIAGVDAPPVDGAEDFVGKASAAFASAGSTFQDLADTASAVDVSDPTALTELLAGAGTVSDPIEKAFSDLESSTPDALGTALDETPECAALSG